MGIAASQARLLTLTSRLNDLEGKAMRFANQKILMSMQQSDMATEYNKKIEAIDALKGSGRTVSKTINVNYQTLRSYGCEINLTDKAKNLQNWKMPTTAKEFVDLMVGSGVAKEISGGALNMSKWLDYDGNVTTGNGCGNTSGIMDFVKRFAKNPNSVNQGAYDPNFAVEFDQAKLEKILGPMIDADGSKLLQNIQNDANLLLEKWQNGYISISYEGTPLAPNDKVNINVVEEIDKETITSMKKAVDSEYDAEIKKVQTAEKRIDLQATQTNTEHQEVSTEMESVKSLIEDNTDRSFNIFG